MSMGSDANGRGLPAPSGLGLSSARSDASAATPPARKKSPPHSRRIGIAGRLQWRTDSRNEDKRC